MTRPFVPPRSVPTPTPATLDQLATVTETDIERASILWRTRLLGTRNVKFAMLLDAPVIADAE